MIIKAALTQLKKILNKITTFFINKKKKKKIFTVVDFLKKFIILSYKKFNEINKPKKLLNWLSFLKLKKKMHKKKLSRKKTRYYHKEFNTKLSLYKEYHLSRPFNLLFIIIFKYEIVRFFIRFPQLYNVWYDNLAFNYFQSTTNSVLSSRKAPNKLLFSNKKRINTNIYTGIKYIFELVKIWLFSGIIFSLSIYVLIFNRTAVLPHFFFFWLCLVMLLYWLLSGFVFFIKKYQYSRFTSVIQRFWRRSYILFWLIESGLLLVFFYLVINPSQESFYMFDQAHFLKTHLFSWRLFMFKSIIIGSLIAYSYLLLLNFKNSTFNKNILFFSLITALLLYFVWIEFYQIYWVSNFYSNYYWAYDLEEAVWSLEWDGRRTRIINHYIMIVFFLKFWHIVFIFGCWIFFLLRANELNRISFPLYSFNIQNFIILFLMVWLFMYPWFRQLFHWSVEIPYFWFYTDTHTSFYKIFIYDVCYFYYNLYNNAAIIFYKYLVVWDFYNLSLFDIFNDNGDFIKHTIKDKIINMLVTY